MIVPTPETHFEPRRRPMVWALVAINLIVQVFVASTPERSSATWSGDSLRTAGRVYLESLKSGGEEIFRAQPAWIQALHAESSLQMEFLGAIAIRRRAFVDALLGGELGRTGDAVAIAKLREELRRFRDAGSEDLTTRLGLSAHNKDTLAWVTYQFSHAGWLHLLSNLVFLLLLGAAVERQLGSLGLFLIYLAGGWMGGMAFLHLQPDGLVPMVGASGAVSALMAFYAFFERRKRVRFFYFILPVTGHMGFIFMSPLLIVPLYLVADFAGLLSAPEAWSSGVAYSAHVGGAVLGAGMALWLRHVLRWKPLEEAPETLPAMLAPDRD